MADKGSWGKPLAALAVLLVIGGASPWWWAKVVPQAPPYMSNLMYGVYLQGNNIESKLADDAITEEECAKACLADSRCRAMSFVPSPWSREGSGVCRLKDRVLASSSALVVISAVKVFPP
jgi:PAN domain